MASSGDAGSDDPSKLRADFDALVDKQRRLYMYIKNSVDNTRKTGIDKVTRNVIDARISRLDDYRNRFETDHYAIEARFASVFPSSGYFVDDLFAATEEAWIAQRGQLLDWRDRLVDPTDSIPDASSLPNCSVAKVHQRTRLPRVSIPTFSGQFEDWPSFRDTFRSIVHDDPTISDVERRHYLVTSVTGEAAALIRGLPNTGASYDLAWARLAARYENVRVLVDSYFTAYDSVPRMRSATATEFRRVVEGVIAAVDAMATVGRPVTTGEDYFVHRAVNLLDGETRREWEKVARSSGEPPTLTALLTFFEDYLQTLVLLDKRSSVSKSAGKSAGKASSRDKRVHHTSARRDGNAGCVACNLSHPLFNCPVYQKKDSSNRYKFVTANRLCFNCLGPHRGDGCESKHTCFVCGAKHHTSLHEALKSRSSGARSETSSGKGVASGKGPVSGKDAESGDESVVTVSRASVWSSRVSLLATARVRVRDRNGDQCAVRVLLDQGANTSLVSEALVNQLRLPRKRSTVRIVGIGGQTKSKGQVTLSLSSSWSDEAVVVTALILPELPDHVVPAGNRSDLGGHLRDLRLADPDLLKDDPCQVLLGSDAYGMILRSGVRRGKAREPIAQRTIFGWIVSGEMSSPSSRPCLQVYHCAAEDELDALVRRFWHQEELPSQSSFLTEEQLKCERHFVDTHVRRSDGRYMVRLPLCLSLSDLSSSCGIALSRLKGLEKRFASNDSLREQYFEFMREYEWLGHMSLVTPGSSLPRVAYLPHHGVLKFCGDSSKLRVVFNGSAVLSSGLTLNQHLSVGRNLLPPLFAVITKWRRHRYAFVTDVEKMYRQVLVHPEDRDLQRVLWRRDPSDPVSEYQLNTITYGLACAPFLAMRTLRQLALDERERYPDGAAVLMDGVYMDDVLAGAATEEEASLLICQLRDLCMAGGFPLRKWASNSKRLLRLIPSTERADGARSLRSWEDNGGHNTLGLRWEPCYDWFTFSVNPLVESVPTKRSVLSQTARLFDPLGWLSPAVVHAKILIQRCWILGLAWDDPLPAKEAADWLRFRGELVCLRDVRVARWLGSGSSTAHLEIHGFADSSELAYAAVVYVRTVDSNGDVSVSLVAGKTKVTPLKRVSLPRLELCAAHLLARLVQTICDVEPFKGSSLYLWSDSSVVLSWILSHPSRWHTYVANRVSAIQEAVPSAVWRHVSGLENPADCASRGLHPGELVTHPLWWSGPPWLAAPSDGWPQSDLCCLKEVPEGRGDVVVSRVTALPAACPLLGRFSSLRRLLRVSSWCLRWLRRIRSRSSGDAPEPPSLPLCLSVSELDHARTCWLLREQSVFYRDEIEALQRGRVVVRSSPLWRLSPIIDRDGLLRVGGRLRHAGLSSDQRHPIIVPASSLLARLIVEECHERTLHGGVQATLGYLRRTYWIPRGRAVVKAFIHGCTSCTRWRATPVTQFMADLPSARVVPSRPFLHTGLDYAGPVLLRVSPGRGGVRRKGFICLFVCFSSRAVHLEAVSDYTSEGFLAAFRRFVSRRGLPSDLYSDQGTNFIGADRALRELFTFAGKERRQMYEGVERLKVTWHFNPPSSPHFGGLWEAAVKSVKHHLRRVIGDSCLTYEEMSTLLAQIEACLNSRPLQALSDDPDDTECLTPGHFLVGAPLSAVPEPSLLDVKSSRLARWQLIQQQRDHFWKRWGEEYLTSLLPRPKWGTPRVDLEIGRLCLIRGELSSPGRWPLARITDLHPGSDGLIRVVTVKTANSELRRPVAKIVLLPGGDKEQF